MIKEIEFKNYRVLKAAKVPLGRCTLIVGPNGCGKSTVLGGLRMLTDAISFRPALFSGQELLQRVVAHDRDRNLSAGGGDNDEVGIKAVWGSPYDGAWVNYLLSRTARNPHNWSPELRTFPLGTTQAAPSHAPDLANPRYKILAGVQIFSLDAAVIARPAMLRPKGVLTDSGGNLAVVLTQLQDGEPERFDALSTELGKWLPEFDRVLLDTTDNGQRTFGLRTRVGRHRIAVEDLSQGVLLALCMLTMAYLPEPPTVLCLEEPDRGIHPRLLREVRDALYRLAYPESVGEKREPVQAIATTHSPYMLDLFREHPEEIVLADKDEQGVSFRRLSDIPHFEEILKDVQLGEAWYSGVFGGVPKTP